jgi:hypothetical protein
LCLSPTNYTRRENGETKISNEEWKILAKKLETPLENIYEADESMVFIFNDNANGNGNIVNNYNIPLSIWETQKKYIEKLEQENEEQKNIILELQTKLSEQI